MVKNKHKERIMNKIMRSCLTMVIDDIIHNNATFWLPTGKRKCCLRMRRTSGEQFMKARQAGKWTDVDFLASNFSGYQIEFRYQYGEVYKWKNVYVNSERKQMITKYTNEGRQYF